MTSPLYFLIKSRPLFAALIILLITFSSFFGYELSPLLFNTSLVLILSTLHFTLFSKQTPPLVLNIQHNEVPIDQEVVKKQAESDPIMLESEIEWSSSVQSPEMSDGSISDEESLIEIALQSGEYVKQDCNKMRKFPNMFWQHELMELCAEFNEEDNLIEIDISMGSIKCSRFEIEA